MRWAVLLNMIIVNQYTWTMFFFYIIVEVIIIVTISQKTNKPLCWNINLDPRYNLWLLSTHPNYYKKSFYFFFTKYKNDKFIIKRIKTNCRKQKHSRLYDLVKILSEPKPKINLSKKKIKEVKKDFSELWYEFSK